MARAAVISVELQGGREWSRALHIVEARIERASWKATEDSMALLERAGKLILRRYTHAPGTRTNSPPGQPPALVSGNLSRSWRSSPVLAGPGPGVYSGKTGPTAIYSRIQELGGKAGENGPTLPKRPYVGPVWSANRERVREIYMTRWTQALTRGGW